MFKRIVSLALALMLLMGMAVITTSAADGSVIEKLIATAKAAVGEGSATITVVDRSGTTQTHTFNVGDTFTVISYLQVPEGKRVNAIDFSQQFNIGDATVELISDVKAVEDPDADDSPYIMFPLVGDAVTNVADGNTIKANASSAVFNNSYRFPNADSILLKAEYKVIASGNTTIKTNILTMATIGSDNIMTPQIQNSIKIGDDVLNTRTVIDGVDEPIMPSENPTLAPTEPAATAAPTEPATEADFTDAPGEDVPTEVIPTSAVWVVADGKWYPVQPNQEVEYIYYLNDGEQVCSLDAATTYDTDGLRWNKPLDDDDELDLASLFPVLKDSVIHNDKVEGKVKYNFSSVSGKSFNTDDKQLIHMNFTVTAEEGVYHIDTDINTVAGKDEHKYIFRYEVIDPLLRAEGVLDALIPTDEHPTEPATEAPATEIPATESAPVTEAPTEKQVLGSAYYLVGTFTDWDVNENYQFFRINNAEAEEYGITHVYLTTADMFKAVKSSKSGKEIAAWYPDGMDNNLSADADGEYTVLFRPNGDGSAADGWIYSPVYEELADSTPGESLSDLAETGYSDNGGYYFKLIPHHTHPDSAATEAPAVESTEPAYEEPTFIPEPATEAPTESPAPATEVPTTEPINEETNGSADSGIGSNVIYFDVATTDWSGYDSIGFHVWSIDDDAFKGYFWEDPEQIGKKASDGKWYYDFDAAGIKIKKGKQYAVVFYAIKDGKATDQTYNLLFGTPCIGHTAFCDGTVVENPEDSEKDTLIAYWDKSIDSSIYGPELQITSIGTVVGTSCPSGSTPYALFLDFLYNKLQNARIYSGRSDQALLDSIGTALGFGQAAVQKAINETGLTIDWTAEKSSLTDDLKVENNSAPVKKSTVTPKDNNSSGTSPHTGTGTIVFIVIAALLAGFAGVIIAAKKLRKAK